MKTTTTYAAQYLTDSGNWVDIIANTSKVRARKNYEHYLNNVGHYSMRLIRRRESVLAEQKGKRARPRPGPSECSSL